MTTLDIYLLAVFAAIWLVPLTMALWWESRLKQNRGYPPADEHSHSKKDMS